MHRPLALVCLLLSSGLFAIPVVAGDDAHEEPDNWAMRSLTRPRVPNCGSFGEPGNPIDAFVGQKLAEQGVPARPRADRRTLIRRVTFDLIGLPPTPEQVAEFEADLRPDAYEKLVDRLLASPHYGERWGRHWLDVVRFAESHGYERDDPKPNAWKYRDYVIQAFNSDKPYDRFLTEQLAGDELPNATAETKIATGLHRLGLIDDEPADPVMDRYDQLDDIVKTVGTTFLGLTLHCARCHDHKFDPIKQSDYYRFVSFFEPSKPYVRDSLESISLAVSDSSEQRRVAELNLSLDRQLAELRQRLEAFASKDATLKKSLEQRIAELEACRPKGIEYALGLTDRGPMAEPTKIRVRGDAHKPGDEVAPGFIKVMDASTPSIPMPDSGSTTGRRTVLARWITSSDQPLTSRVIANRLWHYHFGQGIVGTPSDFGAMGEEATNPQLLDWLAAELVARGWSLKSLHRLILTSSTYQRSSTWDQHAGEVDPENVLHWRFTPRRLEAEPVRDAILAVSGDLNSTMHGPSVMPPIDKVVLAGQSRPGNGWSVSSAHEATRRSLYVFVKRTLPLPELEVLDAACTDEPCPKRPVTTTAPQALTMINSAFTHEESAKFADRLVREVGISVDAQVARAFALAFCRTPSTEEREASLAFLAEQARLIQARPIPIDSSFSASESLRAFCLVLLNSNEFVTVD
jgi:hypothetical protein